MGRGVNIVLGVLIIAAVIMSYAGEGLGIGELEAAYPFALVIIAFILFATGSGGFIKTLAVLLGVGAIVSLANFWGWTIPFVDFGEDLTVMIMSAFFLLIGVFLLFKKSDPKMDPA